MNRPAAVALPVPAPRLRRLVGTATMAALFAVLPALPGCSLFVPAKQAVTLQASDPQAVLYANGERVGVGKAEVKLQRNKSHVLRAETPDGRVTTATVGKTISTTGILDIVGTAFFIFPILGILGPGFWNLDQSYFNLDLPPAPGRSMSPNYGGQNYGQGYNNMPPRQQSNTPPTTR